MRAQPGLVIFDCDGVLVDSEPISNGVLRDMLAAEGVELTLAQTRARLQGLTLAEVGADAESMVGHTLPADWIERFQQERAVRFGTDLAPVPGAREALAGVAAAGIPICVASQGGLEKMRLTLALTGLDQLLPERVRFSATMVERGKPAPDLFLHAAAAMGVEPPRCAVVEDTPSGARAAAAAGMRVIGYCADSDEAALRAAGARELLYDMRDLPALLGIARPEGGQRVR